MIGPSAIDRSRKVFLIVAVGGLALTLIWLGLCAWYIGTYLGWENFQYMQLHELALSLAGVCIPPVLLWLILLFFARANTVASETRELLRHLEAMTYPPDEAEWKVARIADSLKDQADMLSQATDEMIEKMEDMRGSFRHQSQELTGASVRAASQAEQLRESLEAQSKNLSAANERVMVLVTQASEIVDKQVTVLDEAGERARATAGSIALRKAKTDQLIFHIAAGPAADQIMGRNLPIGEGVVGWVVRMASANPWSSALPARLHRVPRAPRREPR